MCGDAAAATGADAATVALGASLVPGMYASTGRVYCAY